MYGPVNVKHATRFGRTFYLQALNTWYLKLKIKCTHVLNVWGLIVCVSHSNSCGPGSSVDIAIGYGLDGPGIESRWGRDFPRLSRPALGPTQPPVQCGTESFPGVKSGLGVTLTPHPLLVPWWWMSRAIPLPMGRTACTEPQCLYKGALYLL